jgi:hypothetical protein
VSPQPIICDHDCPELAAFVISYQDGSRLPSAHCEQHMPAWCVAYLLSAIPPEGLAQLAKALAPDPEPAAEQPPQQERPRRRGGRKQHQTDETAATTPPASDVPADLELVDMSRLRVLQEHDATE